LSWEEGAVVVAGGDSKRTAITWLGAIHGEADSEGGVSNLAGESVCNGRSM
jgi:hypothetical protein